jgi:hypothetical protein
MTSGTSGAGGAQAASRRVFLHVGSPKTGTTFLQEVLWAHKRLAAEQGLLLPGERFNDHYLASLDIRGVAGRPEHPPRAEGMWKQLVEECQGWYGAALVSHELFASATEEQARRALASFGSDTEVHVVLTARDLVRQMSAEWQEHVKHRSTKTFEEFVAGIRKDRRRTSWFWRVQDFADVVDRWGATLDPARVHVVTVPPPTSPPETLWLRFATLLGLDPAAFDTAVSRANTSLGVEQAELLRRVNLRLGERLPLPGPYPTVVKNVLAHRVLAGHKGTRLALSRLDTEYAVDQSRAIADRLAATGVDVVGNLDELVPDVEEATRGASEAAYDPPSTDVLLDESLEAMAELLVVLNHRIRSERRAAELLAHARRKPVRHILVTATEGRPALAKAHRLYQRGRDLLRRGEGDD